MKVAVLSDIHGNYPALQAVLDDADRKRADAIYCLGDLVGYYCLFNEVISEMRKRRIPVIMGNHDYALLYREGVIERSKTATAILRRQLLEITPSNLDFLRSCPMSMEFSVSGKRFFCVHGGLGDFTDEYIKEVNEAYFRMHDFRSDVLVSGHTHIPGIKRAGEKLYMNPGSVGQPRDGDASASYLMVSDDQYELIRVPYDVDEMAAEMEKNNYDSYIYENLYKGVKIGVL